MLSINNIAISIILSALLIFGLTSVTFAVDGTNVVPAQKLTVVKEEAQTIQNGDINVLRVSSKTKNVANTSSISASAKTKVISGMTNLSSKIDLGGFGVKANSVSALVSDAINSNPQLFYVSNGFVYGSDSNNDVIYIKPSYNMSRTSISTAKRKFKIAVDKCIKNIAPRSTNMQKALQVHDYLILNAKYLEGSKSQHNAYGLLVNKEGICQSYALAYKYIMNKLGVQTEYIISNSMNHIWNTVKIGGHWYQVDVTFDDPIRDKLGRVSHTYFLKSDAAMRSLGQSWSSSSVKCLSLKYNNAFWKTSKSEVIVRGKYYYYSKSNGTVVRRTISSGSIKKLKLPDSKWYVRGNNGSYWNWQPTLAKGERGIYVNNSTGVYKISGSCKTRCIKKIKKSSKGYVYGITVINGKLKIAKARSPKSNEIERRYNMKGSY